MSTSKGSASNAPRVLLLTTLVGAVFLIAQTKTTPPPIQDMASIIATFQFCEQKLLDREFMSSSRYQCYLQALQEGIEKHGLNTASRAFEEYITTTENNNLLGACHSWAHELGEIGVESGYTAKEVFDNCSNGCLDGCSNGAGHAYVVLHQDLSGVNEFCNAAGSEVRASGCYHGIGHGFADTLGADVITMVHKCDVIQRKEDRAQCGHAIFMLFNTLPMTQPIASKIPTDMFLYCNRLHEDYRQYCYDYTGYLTYGRTRDIETAFRSCEKVPDSQQHECFRRIGDSLYLSSLQIDKENPRITIEPCQKGDSQEARFWCILGFAKILLTDANVSPEKSFEVCPLFTQKTEQLSCYQTLGEYIEQYRSEQNRRTLCSILQSPFSEACLGDLSRL